MAYISSIDPFNRDIGPGIRILIMFSNDQNCPNIDTVDLLNEIRKYRHYIEINNGGVTFSGDIINNIEYLKEICILCHKSNIRTSLYISECDYLYIKEISKYIDLFIFKDINKLSKNVLDDLNNKKINYLIK